MGEVVPFERPKKRERRYFLEPEAHELPSSDWASALLKAASANFEAAFVLLQDWHRYLTL